MLLCTGSRPICGDDPDALHETSRLPPEHCPLHWRSACRTGARRAPRVPGDQCLRLSVPTSRPTSALVAWPSRIVIHDVQRGRCGTGPLSVTCTAFAVQPGLVCLAGLINILRNTRLLRLSNVPLEDALIVVSDLSTLFPLSSPITNRFTHSPHHLLCISLLAYVPTTCFHYLSQFLSSFLSSLCWSHPPYPFHFPCPTCLRQFAFRLRDASRRSGFDGRFLRPIVYHSRSMWPEFFKI
jgi:hypothetical protein